MIGKLQYISQGATPNEHLENIQKACASGVAWVQLRLKDLDDETLLKTAQQAREITAHFQTRLIINDHYKIAKQVKADGVHLGKTDSCPLEVRAYLGKSYTIGGTANTLQDCKLLVGKKVDYIGLGPFKFTETKKNLSPVLGVLGYQLIIEELKSEIPVIAIGGIKLNDIPEIMDTGVYGVAMSKEITQNFNTVHTIRKAFGSLDQEQVYKLNKE
ncbi:thiamine-phosphate diphosphorylase [Lutibacter agarilyticus]|uniref:Thiamine-phosphate synthase n=1 Tax=Lutibacter agarilyticus TaxID=1109740 RepID=A0A238XGA8_9FLAO|nr:thiamine phosphate synthase [Lutibacter agarilyticus]SNR56959.1 thiamine-phosphate diphosphorylase [Lutibacter agarilyticus]